MNIDNGTETFEGTTLSEFVRKLKGEQGGSRTGANADRGMVPVILDTDIGHDIDDAWALAMLLQMPEFDIRLVCGEYGNSEYRSRLLAKFLDRVGRSDVPVGVGLSADSEPGGLKDWIGSYKIADYPGIVHSDGVQAIIDTIMNSKSPVKVICIGPALNIAAALEREPRIAGNASFYAMGGSIRLGQHGTPPAIAEWNVRKAPIAMQKVFAAPWSCTLAPIDTSGLIRLDGRLYESVASTPSIIIQTLMENYAAWVPSATWLDPRPDIATVSTVLYDTMAVYLAADHSLASMEELPLLVNNDGFTIVDQDFGRPVSVATEWCDFDGYLNMLKYVLCGDLLPT